MAIALDGAGEECRVRPLGLAPETIYGVRLLGPDAQAADLGTTDGLGAELGTEGIVLRRTSEASSWLLVIEEEDA
jgi:hypothetical protein